MHLMCLVLNMMAMEMLRTGGLLKIRQNLTWLQKNWKINFQNIQLEMEYMLMGNTH